MTFTIVMGFLGILTLPFTNTASPLYLSSFDKIATQIVITSEAIASHCEEETCVSGQTCDISSEDIRCVVDKSGCLTEFCEIE